MSLVTKGDALHISCPTSWWFSHCLFSTLAGALAKEKDAAETNESTGTFPLSIPS
jgi:hypothetical protein